MSKLVIPDQVEAREHQAALRASGLIYFVTCKLAGFPIKIGLSNASSIAARLRQLQISLPYALEVLYVQPGDQATETGFHEQFGKLYMRGEWFAPEEPLLRWLRVARHETPDWRERHLGHIRRFATITGETNA